MQVLPCVFVALVSTVFLLQGASVNLMQEPLQVLRHMRAVKKDFREIVEYFVPTSDMAFSWKYHVMLMRQFEQRNPLFLLDECPANNSDSCLLNRKINPHYRQAFEESVVNKIVQREQNEPVQYVSLGSGGLFQDLMVIHKLLKKRSNLALAMHVIDVQYAPCVAMHNTLGGDREVLQDISEHPIVSAGVSCDPKTIDGPTIRGLCIEFMCKQFIGHLKKSFTQAHLSLSVYKDWKDYIDHIERHNMPCADIAVAADIEDEQDQAPKDFALLCKALSEKKSHACNLWLAKNDYTPTVDLITLYTTDAADRKPFYLDDGICMYRSFETIP